MQLLYNSYAMYLYILIIIVMDAIKQVLYLQVRENCRTSLEKKFFLDRVSFDYLEYYGATDESEIDFEQALYDAIYNGMDDSALSIIMSSLMESGIQNTVLSHRK